MAFPTASAASPSAPDATRVPFGEAVLVGRVVLFLIVVYAALAIAGQAIFVTKTIILPGLAAYGVLQRDRHVFLRDWGPYVAATILFDALRGFVFALTEVGWRPVHHLYVIALELLLTGTGAGTLSLQTNWRSPLLDRLFVTWHGTHFLVFLLFGLAVWHYRRAEFWRYRAACLGVMYVGLLCYFLFPTAPPWLASEMGMVPGVVPISHELYRQGISPLIIAALDTNPVAAMPSLHTAFPAACTLLAWRLFGRWVGALFLLYTVVQAVGIVYLGEHYLADVLAGFILAGAVMWEVNRHAHPRVLTLRRAMVYGALLLSATAAAYAATVLIQSGG